MSCRDFAIRLVRPDSANLQQLWPNDSARELLDLSASTNRHKFARSRDLANLCQGYFATKN